jgi:AhpD family alkylhydroperoxidase
MAQFDYPVQAGNFPAILWIIAENKTIHPLSHRTRPIRLTDTEPQERSMKPRLNPFQASPETIKAVIALEDHLVNSGLERSLYYLVKTRASQINGCAYCIHMHTRDARAHGESEERLYLLSAWRESPLYSDRERAALAWTESLTLIAETHAPDNVFEEVKKHFSDDEMVKLTILIGTINAWNRLAISFRSVHPVKAVEAACDIRAGATS